MALLFVAGVAGWTFLEYAIHGWLSHRFHTFATPLHDVHHRDPHAVFTVGAWLPVGLSVLIGLAFFGSSPAMVFFLGLVAGFAAYEAIHYRIHFRLPSSAIEARLRARHLAHHVAAPDAIFGVSTSFWDRVLGTEPASGTMRELEAQVAEVAPLTGPSNWRRALFLPGNRTRNAA